MYGEAMGRRKANMRAYVHRKLLLLSALVVFAFAISLLPNTPASAYSQSKEGRPGPVTAYRIQGSHYDVCPGQWYGPCFNPWVVGTGSVVYRSPASQGTQVISAVYRLQWWNGRSWVKLSDRSHQYYLYRGYSSIQMPRVDFLPTKGGYFRVKMGITWHYANTSQYLGGRVLKFFQRGDYVCNTSFTRFCSAGAGWVYIVSPQ
jgi:hypothetical protein